MSESRSAGSRKLKNRSASWVRSLHLYTSMIGLAATLFFSVTGLTLNHAGWFQSSQPKMTEAKGTIELSLLGMDGKGPDDLAIVEGLRAKHGITAALRGFNTDEYQCSIAFSGPGYTADAVVDRENGSYTLSETRLGWVAVMNDLHKGRDTGPVWSFMIDLAAVVLTLISISGLAMIFWLRLRRRRAWLVALAGTIAIVGCCFF